MPPNVRLRLNIVSSWEVLLFVRGLSARLSSPIYLPPAAPFPRSFIIVVSAPLPLCCFFCAGWWLLMYSGGLLIFCFSLCRHHDPQEEGRGRAGGDLRQRPEGGDVHHRAAGGAHGRGGRRTRRFVSSVRSFVRLVPAFCSFARGNLDGPCTAAAVAPGASILLRVFKVLR